ncbi:MAG TPA: response regulator [Bacteroidota bacterium]|jgi:CheY-like chemotaxis protein
MNILVVDDEREYRTLVGNFLEDQGWTVFLAGDGQEGMDTLYREKIDIIVSDIYMPVMDGLKFHRSVRGNAKFAEIPFLFVSAFDDPHTMDAIKNPRIDGFSRKGRPVADLKSWIQYLLTPVDKRPPTPPGESTRSTGREWRRDLPRTRRR